MPLLWRRLRIAGQSGGLVRLSLHNSQLQSLNKSVASTAQPYQILVVGPAWVGDMVMAQSLFKLLKARRPQCAIDVIAPAWTEPLLARMPQVRAAELLTLGHGQLGLRERLALGRRLQARHYDQAIVLPRSLKAAIVPFRARIRRRTGYLGELRWGLLNDIRALDKQRLPRTVDRFNALALEPGEALVAAPPPQLLAHSASAALDSVQQAPPQGPVLGLCPGAEYGPAKRWPTAYYAEVAEKMIQVPVYKVMMHKMKQMQGHKLDGSLPAMMHH